MHEQSSKVTHCAGRVSAIARPHQHSAHLFDTQKVDLTPANYKYIYVALVCLRLGLVTSHCMQGISVEGQENIQEILTKQLVLCQYICALSILRTGALTSITCIKVSFS